MLGGGLVPGSLVLLGGVELFGLNVLARVRDRDSNALARLADIERDSAASRCEFNQMMDDY